MENNLRKVKARETEIGKTKDGYFHVWGQRGNTTEDIVTFGIVELTDGQVITAAPWNIRFVESF